MLTKFKEDREKRKAAGISSAPAGAPAGPGRPPADREGHRSSRDDHRDRGGYAGERHSSRYECVLILSFYMSHFTHSSLPVVTADESVLVAREGGDTDSFTSFIRPVTQHFHLFNVYFAVITINITEAPMLFIFALTLA